MAVEYFCAYHSYLDALEPLTDAERGRLFVACLKYSKSGEVERLSGNERFVFPVFRGQIDRDNAKYANKCKKQADNANKRWGKDDTNDATAYDGIPNVQPHEKDANDAKEKEKEKEKEKTKAKDNGIYGASAPTRAPEQQGDSCQKATRFVRPTVQEVADYCRERGNQVDAQRFVDYYTANGWRVGKNPMKDWRAAVRTWEKQEGGSPTPVAPRWSKPEIPKGASGELGEAELAAIQRVLAEPVDD